MNIDRSQLFDAFDASTSITNSDTHEDSTSDPLQLSSSLHNITNDQQNSINVLNDESGSNNDLLPDANDGALLDTDDNPATNDTPDDANVASDLADVKPNLVPIYEVHKANNEDILKQLEDTTVEIIDDMEITVITSKGYGKPFKVTDDGLIKREKPDEISGGMAFLATVNKEYSISMK